MTEPLDRGGRSDLPAPAPFQRAVIAADGERLAVQGWETLEARGAVLIATGFSEYAGRYRALGRYLAGRRWSTYAYDPRGHGQSGGPRGHSPSWRLLVEDLGRMRDALGDRFSGRPVLLGVSMGALVALDWMLAHADARALALVAPFFDLAFRPPAWRVALARAAARLHPTLSQPHPLRGRDLSRDPEVIAGYDSDPAINRVMSARYYVEFRAAQKRLAASGGDVRFPVLVLRGGSDSVASPEATAAWVRSVPERWVRSKVYSALRHEVLNEVEREEVYVDLADWLEGALASP